MNINIKKPSQLIFFLIVVYVLYNSIVDFYNIAWGTGGWWGQFSLKWAIIFLVFVTSSSFYCVMIGFLIWRDTFLNSRLTFMLRARNQLKLFRWFFVIVVLILPIWLLQYSYWGIVIYSINLRLIIWSLVVFVLTYFVSENQSRLWDWQGLILSLFLTSAIFSLSASFAEVTNYPFSLGWSEGNRMWDYSLLFGSSRYNYLYNSKPAAYLDFGRQLVGGLPFIFHYLTIKQERIWLSLMTIIPYICLGWVTFSPFQNRLNWKVSFFAAIWVWMFLSQGPIHAPLLWCAVLVAFAWKRPLWLAFPLLMISSYFALVSRTTWVFAPAMWIGMLEIASIPYMKFNFNLQTWKRGIVLVFAGLAGGPFYSTFITLGNWLASLFHTGLASNELPLISLGVVTVSSVSSAVNSQPLLWYRLLPNATYGNGILIGLLIAVFPLMLVIGYLSKARIWILNIWQSFIIVFSLTAFLFVGLIVSAKIGGGGDLHNMDMFLICIVFIVALAWGAIGSEWLTKVNNFPENVRIVIPLTIAIFAFTPLMSLKPISLQEDPEWLVKLTDVKTSKALGLLPSTEAVNDMLDLINQYVKDSQVHGEVLFMDQRQLLTFGYLQDVILIPEYEKKQMMDRALGNDSLYFTPFYHDLASHRFSLIISDPLRTPIKDSDYQFGEENNAWVKWVSNPVLCYYEPILTKPEFRIQLLVPKQNVSDCSQYIQ